MTMLVTVDDQERINLFGPVNAVLNVIGTNGCGKTMVLISTATPKEAVTARSGLPSWLKFAAVMKVGEVSPLNWVSVVRVAKNPNPPVPLLVRMVRELLPPATVLFAVIKSSRPSPLISAATTEMGLSPTV